MSVTNDVVRKISEVKIKFWGMKVLWRRERRYVAIPNMEVWLRLAPDVPDGWSFADVGFMSSCHRGILLLIRMLVETISSKPDYFDIQSMQNPSHLGGARAKFILLVASIDI